MYYCPYNGGTSSGSRARHSKEDSGRPCIQSHSHRHITRQSPVQLNQLPAVQAQRWQACTKQQRARNKQQRQTRPHRGGGQCRDAGAHTQPRAPLLRHTNSCVHPTAAKGAEQQRVPESRSKGTALSALDTLPYTKAAPCSTSPILQWKPRPSDSSCHTGVISRHS